MCVAPQLPHVDKREEGKNPKLNLIFLWNAVSTRAFPRADVLTMVLFTVHRKAKQPIYYLYMQVYNKRSGLEPLVLT